MSILGGIDIYNMGKRFKGGKSPKGRKVRFMNCNGYDFQLEDAKKLLKEGQILTVKEIFVGSWSSNVEFIEFPNKEFNTVMFEDVKEVNK